MSKVLCLLLFVLAASLTKVSAVKNDEKIAFHEAVAPIIAECSLEHGVSQEDLDAAQEAESPDGVKPCFIGCLMRKVEILDDKGFYNPEKGLEKLRRFVNDEDEFAKIETVGRKCTKVNEEPVTDGEAGCDRAQLFVACVMENLQR